MKKRIIRIIVFIIIVFSLTKIINVLKPSHIVDYKVNNNYKVREYYDKKLKEYDFIITNKKNTYVFSIKENKNKKRMIKEIKTYQEKKVECILPKYKKNIESTIYCTNDGKQISNDYLEKTNPDLYQKVSKAVKKKKKQDNRLTKYKKIKIYQKNILDHENILLWDYKGLYILNQEELKYQKIVNQDFYDNVMFTVVDDLFVLFKNDSVKGINTIYTYRLDKDKKDTIQLNKKINKTSYINGVYNHLIYITDPKDKKEYTLNPKNGKLKEIDNDQTEYYIFINQEKINMSMSDFFMEKQYFHNRMVNQEKKIRKEGKYLYWQEDNKLYKAYQDKEEDKILLLELEGLNDWKVFDDTIILISGESLYTYHENFGLREILISKELNYNYENLYMLWKN